MIQNVEPEPSAAGEVFGDRLWLARTYAAALTEFGEELGLIGPLELSRLWSRHILNCAIVAPLFSGSVADIGSGAGLPGIPLAIARPDVQWTLIEPMERRVRWLNDQLQALELDNVAVFRGRAQEYPGQSEFTAVTARAVSALKKLIPICAPLVQGGGELVLLKGANADAEITAARKEIRAHAISDLRVEELGADILETPTRIVRGFVRA